MKTAICLFIFAFLILSVNGLRKYTKAHNTEIGPLQLGSRDQNFPKKIMLWAVTKRIPEMERAYRKYHNGQV